MLELVRGARASWVVVAFLVCGSAFLTSTLKWHGLLRTLGLALDRWLLLRVYAIGYFASSLLPGTIGGDLVRFGMLSPDRGQRLPLVASILLERGTGVVAMIGMAAAAVAYGRRRFATVPVLVVVVVALVSIAAAIAVALDRRLVARLAYRARRVRIGGARKLVMVLYRLHRMVRAMPRRAIAAALVWSVLFYLGTGAFLFCCCRAVGVSVSFVEATSVAVVVCVWMLLPVSLGGLGLRQAGDVYMLGLLGVGSAEALVVSLLRQAIGYAYTILGGLAFLAFRRSAGPA